MVGDLDRLRLVLDHQHGVPFVAQLEQQAVHSRDVVRMEPDGRLVEDIGDVGERGAEVADHLSSLGLAAREGASGPFEREVPQADLDEGIERIAETGQQWCDRWFIETAHPLGQVTDLQAAGVGNADPANRRGPGVFGQPRAVALRTDGGGDRALDKRPDVRLNGVDVLGQHGLLDPGDDALVGDVDPVDLDLRRLLVQQGVEFACREVLDRLVWIEEARATVHASVPAVGGDAGHLDGAAGERLRLVVDLGQVDVGDDPHALTARAHAAETLEGGLFGFLVADFDCAASADGRHIEGEGRRRPDVGFAAPAEQDPQHGVGVGDRADRRTGIAADPLLVDDDRRGQPVQHVDVGPVLPRHEPLYERAVGLVHESL